MCPGRRARGAPQVWRAGSDRQRPRVTRKGHTCPSWLLLWPPPPAYTGKCHTCGPRELHSVLGRGLEWALGLTLAAGGRGESFPGKPGPVLDSRPRAGPGWGGPFFFGPFYPGRTTDTVKGREALIATHRQEDFPEAKRVGSQVLPPMSVRSGPEPGSGFSDRESPRGMPWYSVVGLAVQERI